MIPLSTSHHRHHLLALLLVLPLALGTVLAGEDNVGGNEIGETEQEEDNNQPVTYGGSLSADVIISTHDSDWLSNADASLWLEADLGTLIGAEHWYAFVNPTVVWGAEEDWGWKVDIYQSWLAYDGNDRWNFLVGLLDPSWHFHSLPSSSLCVRMPSRVAGEFSPGGLGLLDLYPLSAPAMRVELKPKDPYYLQVAAFWLQEDHAIRGREIMRHIPSGQRWLLMAEGGWRDDGEEETGWQHRRAALGGWILPAEPETWGIYTFADRKLWSEGDDWQGISGFLSLSTARTAGEAQEHRGTAGLLYDGLLPTRDEDSTALAIIAEHPRHLAWEILHRFSLGEQHWLQLSVQWQDGREEGLENGEDWRIGLRFGAEF